jgi:hypothetical protein
MKRFLRKRNNKYRIYRKDQRDGRYDFKRFGIFQRFLQDTDSTRSVEIDTKNQIGILYFIFTHYQMH